jgi:hypothetical protein
LVYPDDAAHAPRSIHVDLLYDRTLTTSKPPGVCSGFESIQRRREAPQHRPRTWPSGADRGHQTEFIGCRFEHLRELTVWLPRNTVASTGELEASLD